MALGLQHMTHNGRLRELGSCTLVKRMLRVNATAAYNYGEEQLQRWGTEHFSLEADNTKKIQQSQAVGWGGSNWTLEKKISLGPNLSCRLHQLTSSGPFRPTRLRLFKELYFGRSIQIAYEVFPAEKLLSAQAFSVVLTLKIYQSYKPVPTKAAVSLAQTVQLTNYPNTTLVRLSQLR